MTTAAHQAIRVRGRWRLCGWCVAAVLVEVGLYASYRGHDARFHWFTHFFVGAATALAVMTVVVVIRWRPVARPLVWPLAAHLFAMTPDLLFTAGTPTAGGWTCSSATSPSTSHPDETGRG